MSGLPQGWAEVLLTDISAKEKFSIVDGPFGSDLKISDYTPDGTVPVLTTKNIKDYYDPSLVRFISQGKFESVKRSKVEGGDILIAKIGSIGKCCIYSIDAPVAIIPANLCKISVNKEAILNRYLYLQIKSYEFQNKLKDITLATAQPAFSVQRLKTLSINLAPLNEQRRIVAKLEEVLSKVDASQQRLAKIPLILKRFRQAVLAAACSGRLTADWRDENKVDEWEWSTLSKQDVSVQTGPFGSALHKHDYVSNGVPLINPMHIREGQIFPNADQSVSESKMKELTRYVLRPGDIVHGRRGEMGRAAVVRTPGFMCGTGSLILRATSKKVVPDFLCLLLRSPYTCAFLEEGSVGSTMTNLNQQVVGSIEFPIVSPDEQQEIVRRVESFFTLADQLEARYRKARTHVDKLTQSILAKAFRGELVPQDPNDEPAAVLLERIRLEHVAARPVSRKKTLPEKVVSKEPRSRQSKPSQPPTKGAPEATELSKTARRILRHMKLHKEYSKDDILVPLVLSTGEWNKYIRELKAAGVVVQSGDKRGATYRKHI